VNHHHQDQHGSWHVNGGFIHYINEIWGGDLLDLVHEWKKCCLTKIVNPERDTGSSKVMVVIITHIDDSYRTDHSFTFFGQIFHFLRSTDKFD
jgi:hypothetical protein